MNHAEGRLIKNQSDRWEIVYDDRDFGDQLTSGSVCEVRIGDQWIRTRIECADGGYYPVVSGIKLYKGMPTRLP